MICELCGRALTVSAGEPVACSDCARELMATCCICGKPAVVAHLCADCDQELRDGCERDAATDKSDWPL